MNNTPLIEFDVSKYTLARLKNMAHELSVQQPILGTIMDGVPIADYSFARTVVLARVGAADSRNHMIGWLWTFYDPAAPATRIHMSPCNHGSDESSQELAPFSALGN